MQCNLVLLGSDCVQLGRIRGLLGVASENALQVSQNRCVKRSCRTVPGPASENGFGSGEDRSQVGAGL